MTSRVRVLVVDDSAFARKVIREVLERDGRFEVVGIARDGIDALEKIAELRPDVLTLDLVMPSLDGPGVLRELKALAIPDPPRTVIVSMADGDSDLAIAALEAGAFDLVHKPTALATERLFELADELIEKVVAAAASRAPVSARPASRRSLPPATSRSKVRMVVIGASTGGPQAITRVLGELPAGFPVPIAVALHMPMGYTEALARRLDESCALEVIEARDGIELKAGRVVVARAGMHLKIASAPAPHGLLDILPVQKPHRPSVDVLFESAAAAYPGACLGVVLTGMGDDGLIGSQAIRAAQGAVIAEAESTCVVYGMPRVVVEGGLADAYPLDEIASEVVRRS